MKNPIKNYMTLIPYHMQVEDSVESISNKMKELEVQHMPLFSENKLAGIVSQRDVRAALSGHRGNELPISLFMQEDVYSVLPDHPIDDVVKHMAENKIGSCIVKEVEGSVVGIFTYTDALFVLSSLFKHMEGDLLQERIWEFLHKEFPKWKEKLQIR